MLSATFIPQWDTFGMKTKARSSEEYFAALDAERRAALQAVRDLIFGIWPNAEEGISLGTPTYSLNGHTFCALADHKHFMVLYVMHYDLLIAFKNDLKRYDHGATCIRFKRLEPDIMELFDRVIKYTVSRMEDSVHFGRTGNLRSGSVGHRGIQQTTK